jgi:hypothetical protein
VLLQGNKAAELPKSGDIDVLPFGLTACRRDCRPSLIIRCIKTSFREKLLSKTG